MPRTEDSVTILTGMIIAALYVIMLIGFSRESYMRRDAAARVEACDGGLAVNDASKWACRIEGTICSTFFRNGEDEQNCITPIEVMRRLIGQRLYPPTPEGVRQAMQARR
jgi:hypothetical protein